MPADDDDQIDELDDELDEQDDLKALRAAAKKGRKDSSTLLKMQRENLFLKAGIDTETKLGKMLMATFEGDDIDALKAEATEIGLLKPAGDPPPDPARELEDAQRAALQNALPGGAPAGNAAPPTKDPRTAALEEMQTAIREGGDPDAARSDAMLKVIAAGAAGDKRMFFDREAHDQKATDFDRSAMSRGSRPG